MFTPDDITLLGFGEAGTAIARGLSAHYQRDKTVRLAVIDTAYGVGSRGARMVDNSTLNGLVAGREYNERLAQSKLVISVVTGEQATSAATLAKPWLRPGTLYADYNSITGPQTCAVANVFADTDIDFVDVAVMGSFMANGHKAPLLVSGSRAQDMTDWANAVGTPARVLNNTVGDASAVKILRSILMKGLEALSVECLVAAHRQGLVEQVLDNVSDVDNLGFANWLKTLTITHPVHARRRMEEVEKAIENLNETAVPALMSEATRRSHLRTVNVQLDAAQVADLDLESALELLDEHVCRYPAGSDSV